MIQVPIKLKEIEILGHAEYGQKAKTLSVPAFRLWYIISYGMQPGAVHIYFENFSDKYGSYKGLFLITVI